jgi:RNA polymerase sigma-70 factor, ECF subfamily
MELQPSVVTSTNLPAFLGTAGDYGLLKRSEETHEHSPDPRQITALPAKPAESTGERQSDPGGVAEQPTAEHGLSPFQSDADYARASDEELLVAAKSFDERAFDELSSRHLRSIRKRVHTIVRNPEDTEDVVQDSLLKAYRHLPQFRESCGFSTWITKIAVNNALMLLRKRRSRPEVLFDQGSEADSTWRIWDAPDPSPSIERTYARRETLEFMSRAIDKLPALHRIVLDEYHIQEKSVTEAADKLGITIASAKARLFRARRALRSMLEGQRIGLRRPLLGRWKCSRLFEMCVRNLSGRRTPAIARINRSCATGHTTG